MSDDIGDHPDPAVGATPELGLPLALPPNGGSTVRAALGGPPWGGPLTPVAPVAAPASAQPAPGRVGAVRAAA